MPRYTGVLKRKNLWYYRVQHEGKRIESRGFKTAEDANRARAKHLERLLSLDLVHHNMTLADFIGVYVAEYLKTSVRKNTRINTESKVRRYVIPLLGSIRLRDLKTYHVVQFNNTMLKSTTPVTARNAMVTLKKILRKAVEWEYIDHSPFKSKIPCVPPREFPVLELKELFALVDRLEGRDKIIVALAGFAALRRSEIFGLRWEDIDFKAGTLNLRRQYTAGEILPLKTEKSAATIPVWPRLLRMLAEWRLQCGSPDWVFRGPADMPASGKYWQNKKWQEIKKTYHLPPQLRFHDLRHTFASILLAGGATPGDVQKLLRHSTYSTTMNIYRHVMPGQLEKNFEVFNRGSGEQNGEPKSQIT